jgi:tellurite resistance protein TehA-like permease
MKSILIVLVLILIPAFALSAQYHSIGGVQMSTSTVTGSLGLAVVPKANVTSLISTATGQILFCPDCTNAGGVKGIVCVSTGGFSGNTAGGQYVILGSSLTAVTACQ